MNKLIKSALEAGKRAYAPYSKFKVGAAVETSDGKIYTGCNIENASYGLALCAERVALFKAVSDGARKFKRIVIAVNVREPFVPCGACRQVMSEFCPDLEIVLIGTSGKIKKTSLSALFPKPFVLIKGISKNLRSW